MSNITLPTAAEINGLTVTAAAERAYPGQTFDTAIPHDLLIELIDARFDPRGKVVTLYSDDHLYGRLAAVCHDWQIELDTALERARRNAAIRAQAAAQAALDS